MPIKQQSRAQKHELFYLATFIDKSSEELNDFLELEISVSVKVVQVCIGHLMTEHIVNLDTHTFCIVKSN